jgi:ribonuclease BN (tRNA processing enzyme)
MLPPYFPVSLEEMSSTKTIVDINEANTIVLDVDKREPKVVSNAGGRPAPADGTASINISHGLNHPGGGIFNYAITYKGKRVVFATDVEGFVGGDARLITFAKDADLLIHDSQYVPEEYNGTVSNKQGWGHSTVQMAIDVAKGAAVKELILFHHDPEHDDATVDRIEAMAKKEFPNCRAAYEGLEIELD